MKEYGEFWFNNTLKHLMEVYDTTLKYTNNELSEQQLNNLSISNDTNIKTFDKLPNVLSFFDMNFELNKNSKYLSEQCNTLNELFLLNKQVNDIAKCSDNPAEIIELQVKIQEINKLLERTFATCENTLLNTSQQAK